MDLIASAMLIVIPIMRFNIRLAQTSARRHARQQLLLSTAMFILILLFELEIRSVGWSHLIRNTNQTTVYTLLAIHILFSSTTLLLWIACIGYALYNLILQQSPKTHTTDIHRKMGAYTFQGMVATAITGWVFYIAAFCI